MIWHNNLERLFLLFIIHMDTLKKIFKLMYSLKDQYIFRTNSCALTNEKEIHLLTGKQSSSFKGAHLKIILVTDNIKTCFDLPLISLRAFKWGKPWGGAVVGFARPHFSLPSFFITSRKLNWRWSALSSVLVHQKGPAYTCGMWYRWKSPGLAIKKCVFILIFHWLTVSPIIKLKDDTQHMIFEIVHRDFFSKVYFVNTQFLVLLVSNCQSWPGFFTTHCFVVCLCKSLITQIHFFFTGLYIY